MSVLRHRTLPPLRLLEASGGCSRRRGAAVAAVATAAALVGPAPAHAGEAPLAEPAARYDVHQLERHVDCEQNQYQSCVAAASLSATGVFDVSASVNNENLQPVTLHSQRLRAFGVAAGGRTYTFTRGTPRAEVTVRLRVEEARASHDRVVPAFGGLVALDLRFGVRVGCVDGSCSGGGSQASVERTMDPDTAISFAAGEYVYRFTLTGNDGGAIKPGASFTVSPDAGCGVDTSHTSGKASCRVAFSVVDVQVS